MKQNLIQRLYATSLVACKALFCYYYIRQGRLYEGDEVVVAAIRWIFQVTEERERLLQFFYKNIYFPRIYVSGAILLLDIDTISVGTHWNRLNLLFCVVHVQARTGRVRYSQHLMQWLATVVSSADRHTFHVQESA